MKKNLQVKQLKMELAKLQKDYKRVSLENIELSSQLKQLESETGSVIHKRKITVYTILFFYMVFMLLMFFGV